jgi:zinc transport system ATP-binding protein
MTEPATLIELQDICFGYERKPVLQDVSLKISAGDFLAIIGPNGGGKTTLVKIILGLLRPWSGSVRSNLSSRRGAIGYVPQFADFDEAFPLKVFDVVRMGRLGARGPRRFYAKEDNRRVESTLERLGLEAVATSYIGDLSGGQMQRTLIARALVGSPEILFLDEPLGSIDPESRVSVIEALKELRGRIPVVVITHDITPFAGLVEQIACVNRELYYHPGSELTEEMLVQVYGCPVELVAHGVPHRVLGEHRH